GDVFRRPDIDDKIEGAAHVGRRLADIEVDSDAVAMAVIVDRRELESERGPKRTRWRRLAGEVCLAARAAEVDAACAKQRVKLIEELVAGQQRIGELLGADLDDPTHAIERTNTLELDQIVKKTATQTHVT